MKVFISWSKPRAKHVALALRKWLRLVIHDADPWMSDKDIGKGSLGIVEIARNLANADAGIVCLTPENQSQPWLLFEAGAISNRFPDNPLACTLLIGMAHSEVREPLKHFQHSDANRDGILALVSTLYSTLPNKKWETAELTTVFDKHWPDLEKEIKVALSMPVDEKVTERTTDDKIDELLTIARNLERQTPLARSGRPGSIRLSGSATGTVGGNTPQGTPDPNEVRPHIYTDVVQTTQPSA